MTPTIKLNLAHKQVIMMFSGAAVQKVGEITEGWTKADHNHVEHTADVLQKRVDSLEKQFENTDLAKEDQDQLKSFKRMLENDLRNLAFDIQHDQLPKELFDVAKRYIKNMKDMIEVLKAAID